jgi:hypothetical protein
VAAPRQVFISYDRSDRELAVDLVGRLQQEGFSPWIDYHDLGGDSWAAEFGEAIARASVAIVLLGESKLEDRPESSLLQARTQDPSFRLIEIEPRERGSFDRVIALLLGEDAGDPMALSSSMAEARNLLVAHGDNPISALRLAEAVASVHPEYVDGKLERLTVVEDDDGPVRRADEWLREIRTLFSTRAQPELHSRAVVLGLGLLDPAARRELRRLGLEEALVAELDEPINELLTERGLALWEERVEPPSSPEESVPTHADNPATVDELGREGVARLLAARIRDMRRQEKAGFLVHLHAPWGMGKTSLLNFLRRGLGPESRDPWVVIEFNAWRHQRIDPPWWWLMMAVYTQGLAELRRIDRPRARHLRRRELIWRYWIGWPRALVVLALVAAGIAALTLAFVYGGLLGGIASIVAPALAIWAVLRGAGNWVLAGSPHGARQFVESTRDPMKAVNEHFAELIAWLHYPVIILIDDLDRCRGDYVVRLLEGIQTLFRDQPVAYVVAADRDWLSDSYQAAYGDFVSANDEPGRPLGYLFLEKTFQLSVTLPPPSTAIHAGFWGRLLRPGETVDRGVLAAARASADRAFSGLGSEAAIREELQANPGATPLEQQARREAAAIQLASPAVAQEAQHALQPFAGLLDSNPRAMKRLVNAYGMARGIETLGGEDLGGGRAAQQMTALWTILALRWPRLADWLADHPDDIACVGDRAPDDVPEELAPLFTDPEVEAVVAGEGEGIEVRLDAAAIGRCGGQVHV